MQHYCLLLQYMDSSKPVILDFFLCTSWVKLKSHNHCILTNPDFKIYHFKMRQSWKLYFRLDKNRFKTFCSIPSYRRINKFNSVKPTRNSERSTPFLRGSPSFPPPIEISWLPIVLVGINIACATGCVPYICAHNAGALLELLL